MGKPLVDSSTIMQAVNEGAKFISVTPGTLVTSLACDLAKEHGIKIQRSLAEASDNDPVQTPKVLVAADGSSQPNQDIPDSQIESAIKTIITSLLAKDAASAAPAVESGKPRVIHAAKHEAKMEDFPYPGPPPGMQVQVCDVVTGDNGSPIAAGYMTLTKGEFPWTFTYDEIQIVLEGELHIGTPEGVKIGRPGDVMYIPKGAEIVFGTPNWTKFIYVTYPAVWGA